MEIDDARAFLIAEDLIDEHGDEVGAYLQSRIDSLFRSGNIEQFTAWTIIRNAVAITLLASRTRH